MRGAVVHPVLCGYARCLGRRPPKKTKLRDSERPGIRRGDIAAKSRQSRGNRDEARHGD